MIFRIVDRSYGRGRGDNRVFSECCVVYCELFELTSDGGQVERV